MNTNEILIVLATGLIFIIIILACVYFSMVVRQNKEQKKKTEEKDSKIKTYKEYNVESIFDFIDFEKIEDNMIVQKDKKKYLMAIECQGINYDLMSDVEKTSVERGFIQFLNTLRSPIQLYIQTRTVNLEKSIQNYSDKLQKLESELIIKEGKYKQMEQSGKYTAEQLRDQKLEVERQRNLFIYGADVIANTQKTNLSKNVLKKKYYIVLYHYYSNQDNEFVEQDEIKEYVFTELYTRAQSIIRTLYSTGVSGKVLNSQELVDLLYNAYNRDESETYGIEKAEEVGYDQLYVTAPDMLGKKMKSLNEEIEKKAIELAEEAVLIARSEKEKEVEEKEENLEDLINDLAKNLITENRQYIGDDLTKRAIEEIEKKEKPKKKKTSKEDEKHT